MYELIIEKIPQLYSNKYGTFSCGNVRGSSLTNRCAPTQRFVLFNNWRILILKHPCFTQGSQPTLLPSPSTGDSIDWKEPTPEQIVTKVVNGTKPGSILLFHNDLENTTKALPVLLQQLKDKGFEFVTVSELIYPDSYTIDPNGKQIPDKKMSLDINAENVDAVIAEYADEIAAAGFSDEQMAMAAEAIKNGAEIPEDVLAVISEMGVEIPVSAGADIVVDTDTPDLDSDDENNVKGDAAK